MVRGNIQGKSAFFLENEGFLIACCLNVAHIDCYVCEFLHVTIAPNDRIGYLVWWMFATLMLHENINNQ